MIGMRAIKYRLSRTKSRLLRSKSGFLRRSKSTTTLRSSATGVRSEDPANVSTTTSAKDSEPQREPEVPSGVAEAESSALPVDVEDEGCSTAAPTVVKPELSSAPVPVVEDQLPPAPLPSLEPEIHTGSPVDVVEQAPTTAREVAEAKVPTAPRMFTVNSSIDKARQLAGAAAIASSPRPDSNYTGSNTSKRSGLLALPPELRNRIWRMCLVNDGSTYTQTLEERMTESVAINLLRVNKQIKGEAFGIYYGSNIFCFRADDSFAYLFAISRFLGRIGKQGCAHVKTIRLEPEAGQLHQHGCWAYYGCSTPWMAEVWMACRTARVLREHGHCGRTHLNCTTAVAHAQAAIADQYRGMGLERTDHPQRLTDLYVEERQRGKYLGLYGYFLGKDGA